MSNENQEYVKSNGDSQGKKQKESEKKQSLKENIMKTENAMKKSLSLSYEEHLRDKFKILDLSENQCDYVQDVLKKYLMAICISMPNGDVLYFLKVDPRIKIDLFSQFLAALSIFGENAIGKIKRIIIEGLDVEVSIICKYDLIFTAFFRPDMVSDYLEEEGERCLKIFRELFKDQIKNHRTNQAIYERFDDIMCHLIRDYLVRIKVIKK
ncbi:MAG: hypothetical protein ACTSU2_16885 [Promethearchaeota archaeon]